MTYSALILLIFISLLVEGASGYYDFLKSGLYEFLMPFIGLRILLNVTRNQIINNKGVLYFFLFVFSIFLSLLINNSYESNSLEIFRGIKGTFSFLGWPLVYLLTATEVFSKKKIIFLNKLLLFIGYVMAANTLVPVFVYFLSGYNIGELINEHGSIRSFGFLSDQVGYALVYFVVLSLYQKRYLRTLLFIVSILVTGTRGAIFFALMALITVFVFQNQKEYSSKKISTFIQRGIIIVSFLLIAWFGFGGQISALISLRIDDESIESASVQRFSSMESGLLLFSESPFFGVGFGKFSELVYQNSQLSKNFYYNPNQSKEENMRGYANPQNEFVNILVNGGIFSLIILTLFIYTVLKNIRARIKTLDNPEYEIISFIFIILALLFIQTAIFLFNSGITSFIILITLGMGSAKYKYTY
jgi:O-antigen ligase